MKLRSPKISDQRGIAMVLEVVLVVVVLGVVGFTGYTVYSHHKSNTASASSSSTVASASADSSCLATYHDSDLCKFAANSTDLSKQSYKATITETQSGVTSTLVLENDGKGDTSLSGTSNGTAFNSVELAGSTYLEDNGQWIKYPSTSSAPAPTNPTSSMDIGVGSAGITYKKIDTEACGSLTCFKYEVTGGAASGGTQYAWFDNKSYLLREWKYSDSAGNTTDMTISYETINIPTPSPVETIPTSGL